jgi:hypothetical protein
MRIHLPFLGVGMVLTLCAIVLLDQLSENNNIPSSLGFDSISKRDNYNYTKAALDYHFHGTDFTQSFASCVMDPNCQIYYHHVQKAAGSTIENMAVNLVHARQGNRGSCCGDDMMSRFNSSSAYYCQLKFAAFQVRGSQFEQIVKTCMDMDYLLNQSQPQRVIALTSYREPIARTLSYIHQICNKVRTDRSEKKPFSGLKNLTNASLHLQNAKFRTKEVLEACDRCSFEQDVDIWMSYVNKTNIEDMELYNVVRSSFLTSANKVELLAIDAADVSRFFSQLKDALPERYHTALQHAHSANLELTDRCSFGVSSAMIKGLALSTDIYRNLTSGSY